MIEKKNLKIIFSALDRQLAVSGGSGISLVVCGGTALAALGLVTRTTKDVDVLGLLERGRIRKIGKFPSWLSEAATKVARDFNLPDNWLNPGPASALDFGLPEGLLGRVVTRQFGTKLIVHFLGRYDQICFKVYAATDQGPGKHLDDLLLLKPTADEIEQAARWSMSHDSSEGYRQSLRDLLEYIGFGDVAQRL